MIREASNVSDICPLQLIPYLCDEETNDEIADLLIITIDGISYHKSLTVSHWNSDFIVMIIGTQHM